ncbi:MAG: hypothetical protein KDI71_18880 [Xanthomonadales bacterium]|nr:hypothetical protein [Xanthomonadales bacterium]
MRMPILKYFLAALILIAGDASRAEAEIYSEAELHRDFAQLLDFIEETHPDLERGADLAALAQAASRARADLRDGMDQAQAWMAMAQINPWLGDGHSGIRRPSALLERHRDQLLPLAVEFDAAHRLIVSAAPSDSGLQPGTAVSAINGILLAQINARLLARMRGESALLRERLLARYFSDYHWLAFGASESYQITTADGRTISIAAGRPPSASAAPFLLRFLQSNAYLEIRSFEQSLAQQFETFLAESFKQIDQSGSTGLIIDLRANGGGARELSDRLMSYLTDQPYTPISAIKARVAEENIARLPGAELGQVVALTFTQTVTPPAELAHRFTGQVYILIGPQSYSQAVVFAATVQDHGVGQIVGEPTASPANQTAQVKRLRATHSGIEGLAPLYVFTRASGQPGTDPLTPDILIADTIGDPMHSVRELIARISGSG